MVPIAASTGIESIFPSGSDGTAEVEGHDRRAQGL